MNTSNKDWFKARLAENGLTMREQARRMGMDVSSLSRMFSGERRMQMEEARQIAEAVHLPVTEIMRQAGVEVDPAASPPPILLAAVIGPESLIEILSDPLPLPQEVIDRAQASLIQRCPGGAVAAQVRATTGPLAAWDDAVVIYCPSARVEPEAIGALAIVTDAAGRQEMVKVLRARKTGEALVQTMAGETREVMVDTAVPVVAVIP